MRFMRSMFDKGHHYVNNDLLCTFKKMKPRRSSLSLFGVFSLSSAAYLAYDFLYQPEKNDMPITSKKIFIFSDTICNIKKFNAEELLKKELIVRGGLLYRADNLNIALDGSDWIYVLRNDGKIFIEHQKRRVINHTSFGLGFSILSAGEVLIKQGKVYELNEDSGHYRPKNRVQLMEARLQELNVIFHPEYECKNYKSRPRIKKIESSKAF